MQNMLCRMSAVKYVLGNITVNMFETKTGAFANGTPMTVVEFSNGESHRYRPDNVGKLTIDGDMGLAMQLAQVLS